MDYVKCITERSSVPGQLTIGKHYWLDKKSIYKDPDGDSYANIYFDENKSKFIGNLNCKHFKYVDDGK